MTRFSGNEMDFAGMNLNVKPQSTADLLDAPSSASMKNSVFVTRINGSNASLSSYSILGDISLSSHSTQNHLRSPSEQLKKQHKSNSSQWIDKNFPVVNLLQKSKQEHTTSFLHNQDKSYVKSDVSSSILSHISLPSSPSINLKPKIRNIVQLSNLAGYPNASLFMKPNIEQTPQIPPEIVQKAKKPIIKSQKSEVISMAKFRDQLEKRSVKTLTKSPAELTSTQFEESLDINFSKKIIDDSEATANISTQNKWLSTHSNSKQAKFFSKMFFVDKSRQQPPVVATAVNNQKMHLRQFQEFEFENELITPMKPRNRRSIHVLHLNPLRNHPLESISYRIPVYHKIHEDEYFFEDSLEQRKKDLDDILIYCQTKLGLSYPLKFLSLIDETPIAQIRDIPTNEEFIIISNSANEPFWIKLFEAMKIEKPSKDSFDNLIRNIKAKNDRKEDVLSFLASKEGLLSLLGQFNEIKIIEHPRSMSQSSTPSLPRINLNESRTQLYFKTKNSKEKPFFQSVQQTKGQVKEKHDISLLNRGGSKKSVQQRNIIQKNIDEHRSIDVEMKKQYTTLNNAAKVDAILAKTSFSRYELHLLFSKFKALISYKAKFRNKLKKSPKELIEDGVDVISFRRGVDSLLVAPTEQIEKIFQSQNAFVSKEQGGMNWEGFVYALDMIEAKTDNAKIDLFMRLLDDDQSGTISYNEIFDQSNQLLKQLYKSSDINGVDGITLDEISHFLTKIIFDAVGQKYDEEILTEDLKHQIKKKNKDLDLLLMLCFYNSEQPYHYYSNSDEEEYEKKKAFQMKV